MLLNDMLVKFVELGIGTVGVNLFMTNMPAMPDTCTAIFDTGGLPPTRSHSRANVNTTERPAFQALFRSKSYETAMQKAMLAYNALNVANVTINGVRYLSITPVQSPFSIGRDDGQRDQISLNFNVER